NASTSCMLDIPFLPMLGSVIRGRGRLLCKRADHAVCKGTCGEVAEKVGKLEFNPELPSEGVDQAEAKQRIPARRDKTLVGLECFTIDDEQLLPDCVHR